MSASCVLHNYLKNLKSSYCPKNFTDHYDENGHLIEGDWRKNVQDMTHLDKNPLRQMRPVDSAKNIREIFKAFVNSPEGSLDWQRKAVFLE